MRRKVKQGENVKIVCVAPENTVLKRFIQTYDPFSRNFFFLLWVKKKTFNGTAVYKIPL